MRSAMRPTGVARPEAASGRGPFLGAVLGLKVVPDVLPVVAVALLPPSLTQSAPTGAAVLLLLLLLHLNPPELGTLPGSWAATPTPPQAVCCGAWGRVTTAATCACKPAWFRLSHVWEQGRLHADWPERSSALTSKPAPGC